MNAMSIIPLAYRSGAMSAIPNMPIAASAKKRTTIKNRRHKADQAERLGHQIPRRRATVGREIKGEITTGSQYSCKSPYFPSLRVTATVPILQTQIRL